MAPSIRPYRHMNILKDLDVEKIKKYGRLHVRCGTNFLLVVMVVAIFVFAFWANRRYIFEDHIADSPYTSHSGHLL
jgi:uncharacterized protein YqhQ